MVKNEFFLNNSKNIDIWILRKERNLFRSEFYMCVPNLVKIDWEMAAKNPRWPPRNLFVFLHFNIRPRWFPAHHRDRLAIIIICQKVAIYDLISSNFFKFCWLVICSGAQVQVQHKLGYSHISLFISNALELGCWTRLSHKSRTKYDYRCLYLCGRTNFNAL